MTHRRQEANQIAGCVLSTFDALPQKCKPRIYPDGKREWTTLCGIVLNRGADDYKCVALGTGLKCLPQVKLPLANGVCLHDWHAEVVSIRAFNLYLLDECLRSLTTPGYTSPYVYQHDSTQTSGPPFTIRSDVTISMYCSSAPCGDASMELTMAAQADATPWKDPAPTEDEGGLKGRGHFSQLGVVRRKPARADAPPSLSKSCSDKLALKQCTSLLMSLTSLLISPEHAYLNQLVLPADQYVDAAVQRAFRPNGRMSLFRGLGDVSVLMWACNYRFQPFQIEITDREFRFAREKAFPQDKPAGSNITAMSTGSTTEVVVNGALQGRKQFAADSGSAVSRKRMWRLAVAVQDRLPEQGPQRLLHHHSYAQLKECQLLDSRRKVKSDVRSTALKGWQRNSGDDAFKFE